ncbi:unnamed protein product [Protopolystoma xenopodis]|uniref:Uncharacterized protein n=1 Tax=Protopolystoma xenopodis TaxID=117903 RepID=A0A448WUB8_9PLAT|nr:unnamed protein product [Protopolystoma xenopodis]
MLGVTGGLAGYCRFLLPHTKWDIRTADWSRQQLEGSRRICGQPSRPVTLEVVRRTIASCRQRVWLPIVAFDHVSPRGRKLFSGASHEPIVGAHGWPIHSSWPSCPPRRCRAIRLFRLQRRRLLSPEGGCVRRARNRAAAGRREGDEGSGK